MFNLGEGALSTLDRLIELIHPEDRPAFEKSLSIDIDRFNRINDSLGHVAGDLLLKEVVNRIKGVLRASDCLTRSADAGADMMDQDTLARIDGDHFLVLLPEISRPEDAAIVADRINASIASPFLVTHTETHLTVSMGITLFPENGEDSDTLLVHADAAMRQAKSEGRNNYQFFSESTNEKGTRSFKFGTRSASRPRTKRVRALLSTEDRLTSTRASRNRSAAALASS